MDLVLEMFWKLKKSVGYIHSITADDEFNARKFVDLCKNNGIKLYTDIAKDDHQTQGNKLGLGDRAARTIKLLLTRNVLSKNGKWFELLDDVLINYNNSVHSSLHTCVEERNNSTPNKVFENPILTDNIFVENLLHNGKINTNHF